MADKHIVRGEFGDTPFSVIQQSTILTDSDFAKLQPLTEELKETFSKSQVFRTRTEMEVSVLNNLKHPTPASKYWQATREQNVMFTEMVMLSYEYRKNVVEIKKLKKEIAIELDELEKELKQIEIERKQFLLKGQERTAKDRIREITAWSEIKAREAEKMTKEDLDDVDNHQLVSYTKRWLGQRAAMGNGGSPAEKQNLQGQLQSGLDICEKKGLTKNVLEGLPEQVKSVATPFLIEG